MTPVRIGLVGTGWVAHQHVAGYRAVASDVVEVTAVCDPRADVREQFADRYGIASQFGDARELIRSGEVDALALLTPPAVRDEIIYPALESGLHLLVEKPFATNGSSAVRYVADAEAVGTTLAVSQNFRWFPEYRWLKSHLERPIAGIPQYVEATSFQDRPQTLGQWRAEESKLEMAIYSVHLIDRIQWLMAAEPLQVSAVTRPGRDQRVRGEQFTTLTVEFEGGAVARMTSSWLSLGAPEQRVRIDTNRGSLRASRALPMEGTATAEANFRDETQWEVFLDEPPAHMIGSYGGSGREFASAILEGRDATHSGRDNLKTVGIMEAAYLSAARDGAVVEVAEAMSVGRASATGRS